MPSGRSHAEAVSIFLHVKIPYRERALLVDAVARALDKARSKPRAFGAMTCKNCGCTYEQHVHVRRAKGLQYPNLFTQCTEFLVCD